ncbi:hypothetical protein GGS21DRAFT_357908 [Xylaria nigripes]|nr:hypothetical protein GGS21DRAFT_357908 [Xylaria nigripes]
MGAASSPPKRMTRARAAAASARATASTSVSASQTSRVTKATKATRATKSSTAKAVKPAAKPAATKSAPRSTTTRTAAAAKSAASQPAAAGSADAESTEAQPTAAKPAAAKSNTTTKTTVTKTTATKTAVTKTAPAAKTATTKTAPAAKSTASAATTTRLTTRKRKARYYSDDDEEDDLSKEDDNQYTMNRPAKKLRGPANKATHPKTLTDSQSSLQSQDKEEPTATSSSTTTRTTRCTRAQANKLAAAAAPATNNKKQASAKISRPRTRKTTTQDDDASSSTTSTTEKSDKKTTRTRAAEGTITTTYDTEPTPGLKSAVSRPATKTDGGLKKTVTFEEPEKENLQPNSATAATTNSIATGMRAKPVRKPALSGRTTRASARAATAETTEKKPLSPKKDVQNRSLSRDAGSDDELATYEKTPTKPLNQSPVRPPNTINTLELPSPEEERDEKSASALSSPARRPPSPFKDTMKSPAKRVDGVPTLLFPTTSAEIKDAPSPSKSTMLQSPPKRLQMPLPALHQLNHDHVGAPRSPTKMSVLNTPAKRPVSPLKFTDAPIPQTEESSQETPKDTVFRSLQELSEEQLQYQIRADIGLLSPPEPAAVENTETIVEFEDQDSMELVTPTRQATSTGRLSAAENQPEHDAEVSSEDIFGVESSTPQLAFPGRLSAVLPRHADPALNPQKSEDVVMSEPLTHETNVEASDEDSMDLFESAIEEKSAGVSAVAIEEQPMEVCVAESNEESTNAPEDETIEEFHEVYVPGFEDESMKTPEDELIEQSKEAYATEPKEQAVDASIVEANDEHMEDCEMTSVEKCDSKTEEPAVLSPIQTTTTQPAPEQADIDLQTKNLQQDSTSDSEDELSLGNENVTKNQGEKTDDTVPSPSTPALPPIFKSTERKIPESVSRAAARAIASVVRHNNPPSRRDTWRALSSVKGREAEPDEDEYSLVEDDEVPPVEATDESSNEVGVDEMKDEIDEEAKERIDELTQAAIEAYLEADIAAKFDKYDFDLNEEDLIADMEGYEMSPPNTPVHRDSRLSSITEASEESDAETTLPPKTPLPRNSRLSSITEASEEGDDVDTMPIDPVLLSNNNANTQPNRVAPVTPYQPIVSRAYHTVSKVPLKPADDSTPRDAKRHCSTASKATLQRPTVPLNSFHSTQTNEPSKPALYIPSRSLGPPVRLGRPDLNPTLLRGAIVYVDVHTSEGADAGRIFVDLLIQMGARCVKAWPWNPAYSDGEPDRAQVGITHVVFKDGSKRTLEKVVQSNGLVQCVGVSWVLDCERENEWLNEIEYCVDTTVIPRGGHNRRKSMEPKAIANVNGTLVTPTRANSALPREPQTLPNNYMSRRDSTVWMRTPSEHDEDEDAPSEMDWEPTVLTPVPQTPAPETVARFALDISPGTPSTAAASSPANNEPLMQTCPPKPTGLFNIGESLVNRGQDQSVMMRLMAARRKSLQFAPKVASPLKKQWN